jgi:hypothetical protein
MPCDTRSPQPTYTFAQAVTHTHTHTHTHPLLCPRALLFPQSGSQVTFTAIWRRNLFWMTKRLHATRRIVREGMAAREAAAREPSVLMVRRSQPADPARARLFRASIRFPTRSRLLSLCAHFPCATMSVRAGCGAQEWSFDTMTL